MKIESFENGIRLIPENDWEKQQLKRLGSSSIQKQGFKDAEWKTGPYEFIFAPDWDRSNRR